MANCGISIWCCIDHFDPLVPANMQIAPTKKVQLPDWKVALDFEVQVFNAS